MSSSTCTRCISFSFSNKDNPYNPGYCSYWGTPVKTFDSCPDYEFRKSPLFPEGLFSYSNQPISSGGNNGENK